MKNKESKPRIISQEDHKQKRTYKIADEYVNDYFDNEFLHDLEYTDENVKTFIREAYFDGYEDALRDIYLILKQLKDETI